MSADEDIHQSVCIQDNHLYNYICRELTELKKRQAKQSIDEAKSLNADRSIKSKEEKER